VQVVARLDLEVLENPSNHSRQDLKSVTAKIYKALNFLGAIPEVHYFFFALIF
jgi:hypothetical protein